MRAILKRILPEYSNYKGILDTLRFLSGMKKDSSVKDVRMASKAMGNDSLIVEGVYQNYPNCSYSDFYLSKTAELLVKINLG